MVSKAFCHRSLGHVRLTSPATLACSTVGLRPPISQLGSDPDPLPDRLMVGLRFLVPSIGVRAPVRQQSAGPKHESV